MNARVRRNRQQARILHHQRHSRDIGSPVADRILQALFREFILRIELQCRSKIG